MRKLVRNAGSAWALAAARSAALGTPPEAPVAPTCEVLLGGPEMTLKAVEPLLDGTVFDRTSAHHSLARPLLGRVLGQRVKTSRFWLSGCEDAL